MAHSDQSADKPKKAFEIDVVCDAFQKCIEDKNSIDLSSYLTGFNELLRSGHYRR